MIHEPWCRHKGETHTDAAKRVSDTYNLHRIGAQYDSIGKWFACALQDGSSDNTLYDSKLSCVRHQHHNEQYYMFVKIAPNSMNVCEAEVMVKTHRRMYSAGLRMTDPDHKHGGPDLIKRLTISDQMALARGAVTGLVLPGYEKN